MTKFFERPVWGITAIGFGLMLLVSGTEWYHYILAIIGFASGGHTIYKYYQNKKFTTSRPICNNCGHVARDERELHNHQITCQRKT